MKPWVRFLVLSALFVGSIIAVTPASANHKSNPVWVVCNPVTGEVSVTLSVFDDGVGNGNQITFMVDGVSQPDYIDFGYGIAPGTYTQSIILPEAAHYGIEVIATDGDTDVSTACGVMESVPVPTGFVLHTISCNTPVYNLPAGTPVGDNAVTAGQTWFVSPTPVAGGDGVSWTEIFVAGALDGFIPTACVGGPAQ